MRLNWVSYFFHPFDGYGRYARYMVQSLARLGVEVHPILLEQLDMPGWIQRMAGLDWSRLTITCAPPYMFPGLAGRQWGLTMTEGSALPEGWAKHCDGCERIIVPCEQNATAFKSSGVRVPIHVVPGGTSPVEFPMVYSKPRRPYTFLALGDRGSRKGWTEVWQAFFMAFHDTPDVRLVVKTRPNTNDLIDRISMASNRDPRISFWMQDVDTMADVYAQVDCVAIPSKSEGWGMPHREAAMMAIPTIVTRYSGLDDGHTDDWATVVLDDYKLVDIPSGYADHIDGQWAQVDVGALADAMRWCYDHPAQAKEKAHAGAAWLRENQTWEHAGRAMLDLLERWG